MCSMKSCKLNFEHFGFVGASADQFTRIQWSDNNKIYFFYRLFVLCYVIGWYIFGYITDLEANFYQLFSYWTEGMLLMYSFISFFISIRGIYKDETSSATNSLRWFHKLNWVLFEIVSASTIFVLLLFWITVAPTRTAAENTTPVTLHLHLIIPIIQFIDLFMVAYPVRFLHFIYAMLYGTVYSVFLLILHFTSVNSAVYPITDLEMDPLFAGVVLAVVAFVATSLIHWSYVFGLNRLSRYIASTCCAYTTQISSHTLA